MSEPRVIKDMRLDKTLAEWKAATTLLEAYGREGAVAKIESWVGYLSIVESELLIYMVRQLALEAESLAYQPGR